MKASNRDDTMFAYDKLTLGLLKSLESRPGICDVIFDKKCAVSKAQLHQWEQKYSCILPEDIKNFYLTSNGLNLKWSVKMNENKIGVGHLFINPLEKLQRVAGGTTSPTHSANKDSTSLRELEQESGDQCIEPHFDQRSRIFDLDDCEGFGKVCLVYNNTKPGVPAEFCQVWFLDRSLEWHLVADNFLDYYRLLLLHLGLPFWQYKFTSIGIPPSSQQWYALFAPMLRNMEDDQEAYSGPINAENIISTPDFGKVFKGKSDKRLLGTQTTKKKTGPPSARSSGQGSRSHIIKQGNKQ